MMFNKASLSVVGAAPDAKDEPTRYAVKGVLLDETGTTATDGVVMAHVSPAPNTDADYPDIGIEPSASATILPLDAAEQMLRVVKKQAKKSPDCARCVQLGEQNGLPVVGHIDLEDETVVPFSPVAEDFPRWWNALPLSAPDASAVITLDNLKRLVKIVRDFGAWGVKLELRGDRNAVVVKAANDDGQHLTIALSAYRAADDESFDDPGLRGRF